MRKRFGRAAMVGRAWGKGGRQREKGGRRRGKGAGERGKGAWRRERRPAAVAEARRGWGGGRCHQGCTGMHRGEMQRGDSARLKSTFRSNGAGGHLRLGECLLDAVQAVEERAKGQRSCRASGPVLLQVRVARCGQMLRCHSLRPCRSRHIRTSPGCLRTSSPSFHRCRHIRRRSSCCAAAGRPQFGPVDGCQTISELKAPSFEQEVESIHTRTQEVFSQGQVWQRPRERARLGDSAALNRAVLELERSRTVA